MEKVYKKKKKKKKVLAHTKVAYQQKIRKNWWVTK